MDDQSGTGWNFNSDVGKLTTPVNNVTVHGAITVTPCECCKNYQVYRKETSWLNG